MTPQREFFSGGSYNTVDLPEGGASTASAINDSGQIAGVAGSGANAKGFLYSAGSYSRIQFPDSNYTEVVGLNNVGDLVGLIDNPRAPSRGFRRTVAGFLLIEPPDSPASWEARGINDLGQIVGAFTGRDGKIHGYRATPTALRVGPPDSQGVTRITDNSGPRANGRGAASPTEARGRGRASAPGNPSDASGDRGRSNARVGAVVRQLEGTRDGFRRVGNALERAVVDAVDREHERELAAGRAMAMVTMAMEDADAAIAYIRQRPDAARTETPESARIEFTFPEADRGRNPSLQVGLNQLNITVRSLLQIPGGELGEFRAKLLADANAIANHIVAANRAPRDSRRGRGGTAEAQPESAITPR